MKAVQKLKQGELAKLSFSQIANLLINLPDANRNLSPQEFRNVYYVYRVFQKDKKKILMDMETYCQFAITVIRACDAWAPYEKYCGGNEYEYGKFMEELRASNWDADFSVLRFFL